jgi:hypothetical protein
MNYEGWEYPSMEVNGMKLRELREQQALGYSLSLVLLPQLHMYTPHLEARICRTGGTNGVEEVQRGL